MCAGGHVRAGGPPPLGALQRRVGLSPSAPCRARPAQPLSPVLQLIPVTVGGWTRACTWLRMATSVQTGRRCVSMAGRGSPRPSGREPAAPAALAGTLRELSFLLVSNGRCCAPLRSTGCVCPSVRLTACPTPAGDECKGRKHLETHVSTRSRPGGLAGTLGLALSRAGCLALLPCSSDVSVVS